MQDENKYWRPEVNRKSQFAKKKDVWMKKFELKSVYE